MVEDSAKGFESALGARRLLSEIGVELDLHLWGISEREVKRRALQGDGATLFNHVNEALKSVFNLQAPRFERPHLS